METARVNIALSYWPALVSASTHLDGSNESIRFVANKLLTNNAPQGTKTESSLFAPYSIVGLGSVVTVDQVLNDSAVRLVQRQEEETHI
jgi:hypothetical protein